MIKLQTTPNQNPQNKIWNKNNNLERKVLQEGSKK